MEIFLLGTNHKTADVDFRGKIAFPADSFPGAFKTLLSSQGIQEGLILSTCNRTEIYAAGTGEIFNTLDDFLSHFAAKRRNPLCDL